MAASLKKAGIQAEPYHAGLSDRERIAVQDRWVAAEFCKVCDFMSINWPWTISTHLMPV